VRDENEDYRSTLRGTVADGGHHRGYQ
jgi:hypothetical protein